MNNIKIFDQDLPNEIDLSNEKVIGLDCEALGLVLGRDPLTLVQLGLESKKYFLVKSTFTMIHFLKISQMCL